MKILLWHLGLGDAIICAPMAVALAKKHGGLVVPCYANNMPSVQSLFVNHPEIKVVAVPGDSDLMTRKDSAPDLCIPVGYFAGERPTDVTFDQWFYDCVGLDYYKTREEFCPLEKAAATMPQKAVPDDWYAFVHHRPSRGYKIDLNRIGGLCDIIYHRGHESVLAYWNLIKEAYQVHCIDSSFLHLADRVPMEGLLFYHKYARPNSEMVHFKSEVTIYDSAAA